MIKTCIKVAILLVVFTFILSFEVGNKPLFGHLYEYVAPASKLAQKKTTGFLEDSFETTKDYSKKLFDNSVPKFKDSVKSKLSSRGKVKGGEPAEKITEEEKSQLNDLIKNH